MARPAWASLGRSELGLSVPAKLLVPAKHVWNRPRLSYGWKRKWPLPKKAAPCLVEPCSAEPCLAIPDDRTIASSWPAGPVVAATDVPVGPALPASKSTKSANLARYAGFREFSTACPCRESPGEARERAQRSLLLPFAPQSAPAWLLGGLVGVSGSGRRWVCRRRRRGVPSRPGSHNRRSARLMQQNPPLGG